mgnify:CR=1 FL=1
MIATLLYILKYLDVVNTTLDHATLMHDANATFNFDQVMHYTNKTLHAAVVHDANGSHGVNASFHQVKCQTFHHASVVQRVN